MRFSRILIWITYFSLPPQYFFSCFFLCPSESPEHLSTQRSLLFHGVIHTVILKRWIFVDKYPLVCYNIIKEKGPVWSFFLFYDLPGL